MTHQMREWTDFADGALVFPFAGATYTTPEIGIALGQRLNAITNNGAEADLNLLDLMPDLLGPAWEQMQADNVPLAFATRVAATVLADFQYGREYAEAMWETGGNPTAAAEFMKARGNRATRRAKTRLPKDDDRPSTAARAAGHHD